MQFKLVLLIGQAFIDERQTFLKIFKNCHCVFAKNGLRGLAMAVVMHPDVVVCKRDSSLISTDLIRYEVLHINSHCKFLIMDDEKVAE
ncbi:MAG: hypothetical protein LBS87_02085 [Puniceicoccales bacterium]|jgi:hypothetical protein|nr:hypothetical protein [Puniceicoccales bacterium]